MNANELADELDDIDAYEKHQTLLGKASETLRQQQAEIEELKTCLIVEQEHNERIVAVASDPKQAAIAYGQRFGSCAVCGRELTDGDSVDRGIGPICAGKYGW